MPDPRPLASLRLGGFDEPPARIEAPTPPPVTNRARYAMPPTRETDGEVPAPRITFPMPTTSLRSRLYPGSSPRRRRRSDGSMNPRDGAEYPDSSGGEMTSRPYKRRKLGSSTSPGQLKPAIRYGWYGQVEPGRLKMELVSCDGGEHRDVRHPDTFLGPENLLKHDKSVYCSEAPEANILLRHADDRPFCLEKIHIVGPDYGFTAPVQEGLVYVAMTMKDLEKYIGPPPHARRQHREPQRGPRQPPTSSDLLSFREALRDPAVNAALEERRSQSSRSGNGASDSDLTGNYINLMQAAAEAHCEIPIGSDAHYLSFDNDDDNNPSHDRLVTILSDEEIGPEDSSPQDVLDYRLQRLRLARRRHEIDRFDTDERWAGLNRIPPSPEQVPPRLDVLMARSHVYDSSSPERDSGPTTHHPRYSGLGRKDGDPNVVWTPFSIRRNKHKITIKLDPPVSGRFVLLKLWAHSKNVDVQSVVLKGYGGQRFFPAVSLR